MLARRIEEVSLNAWPAIQQLLLDGWILRFSRGHTKRANSVNALYPSQIPVRDKIAACEAHYQQRELPIIFRITPFSTPPDLDQVLADEGYERIDPTLVMYLDLEYLKPAVSAKGRLCCETVDDWLSALCELRGERLAIHQAHREILNSIPGRRLPVSLRERGQPVACGLSVVECSFVGLFDFITHPGQRNKGYGTALLDGMLGMSRECGARHAYLQVMENNAAARHVYGKSGFQTLYRYWYRVRPAEA